MKTTKLFARVMCVVLCVVLMSTTALAATGTPYTGKASDITAPAGQQATLIVDGVVTRFDNSDAEYDGNATVVYTDDLDAAGSRLSSFTAGGADETDNDYAYHAALFVDETGVVDSKSATEAMTEGTYDGEKAEGVKIEANDPSFNGIIVAGGVDYTISGADIQMITDGDGLQSCDFSGKGTAITSFGEGTKLTVADSNIEVAGVAAMAFFADSGSTMTIRNSTFHSAGGTLHDGYKNSPSQNTMVAPPWILGIMGSSRATNLEGNNTTMNVIDSAASAGKWAVLSTDSGSNMKLNVVNTTMELTGADYEMQADGTYKDADGDPNPYTKKSGYGTYTIGNADENFYGVTMDVGTYANIFTGGSATYTNLEAGKTYELMDANGEVSEVYEATEDKNTVINSDTFGFMAHQGSNTLTVENGTEVYSNYASLLVKDPQGTVTMNINSGSTLTSANGILLQILDNDDSTTGMDVSTFSFYTSHTEDAGWPSENGNVSSQQTETEENVAAADMGGMVAADGTMTPAEGEAPPDGDPGMGGGEGGPGGDMGGGMGGGSSEPVVHQLNVETTELSGDIYNGSGYYGETAVGLAVNLGTDAVLNSAIAQTETIHADTINYTSKVLPEGTTAEEAGQITEFTIAEYYQIGQMANRYYNNGDNTIAVNLTNNAVWNVTGDCLISSLSIADGATVQGANGDIVMTVDGVEIEIAAGDYEGEIRISYTEAAPVEEEPVEESVVEPEEAPVEEAPVKEEAAAEEAPVEETEAPAESSNTTVIVVVILVIVVAAVVVLVVLKKKKK